MTRIIDAHTHLGLETFVVKPIPTEKRKRPAFRDPLEHRVENLLRRMDTNGVSRAVAFPYPLEEVDPVLVNTYVLDACHAYPDRIIPFALIGDDVDQWLEQGAKGFKQHAILQTPERFNLPRAYRRMAAAQTPLIIHARSLAPEQVTQQIREILNSAPDLRVIVAHMGRHTPNTSEHVEANLQGLRDQANVFFETSTVRDSLIIQRAVELVGENRILFGSDSPFNSHLDADPLAVEIDIIRQAGFPPRVEDKILGGNLMRLLGI
ncbi:MAG: amidohydrolase [Chloroflexi bacterium]|nr:amidohydrolase [Chloroflexota bacterium]